jgi:hypothetical protein
MKDIDIPERVQQYIVDIIDELRRTDEYIIL